MSAQTPSSELEAALVASLEDDSHDALYLAMATGEIVIPQMGKAPPEQEVMLPFVERLGMVYALVFSSHERLAESDLEPRDVVTMRGDKLAQAWPRHEDVWLAIDPGTDHGAALSPASVRRLASFTGG